MIEKKNITGRYQGSGRGFGFFIPEDSAGRGDDSFVPPRRAAAPPGSSRSWSAPIRRSPAPSKS